MIELITTFATCIARSGGTAFPMVFAIVVGRYPLNENQSGNVWIDDLMRSQWTSRSSRDG